MINKYAILDCDFISKLFITQNTVGQRFIDLILSIKEFSFISHQQTIIELSKHNKEIVDHIISSNKVTFYSDKDLISLFMNYYNQSSYLLFINMLHNSCNVFSSSLFDDHYLSLVNYVRADQNNINIDQFVNFLEQCDLSIPNGNNLGEIKLYTLSQLFQLITQNIYIFCSDDRKARYILSANANIECISCLSSFYLTKKYLRLSKQEAQCFFDSWQTFHQQLGQYLFQIYDRSGNQLIKLPAQIIFNLLYDDKLELMKDGFFHIIHL